jgi:hypothetical protein
MMRWAKPYMRVDWVGCARFELDRKRDNVVRLREGPIFPANSASAALTGRKSQTGRRDPRIFRWLPLIVEFTGCFPRAGRYHRPLTFLKDKRAFGVVVESLAGDDREKARHFWR